MQDPDFPALSGVRIVRIAVHPDLPRAGYGSRAVELLRRYTHIYMYMFQALVSFGQVRSGLLSPHQDF